MAETRITRRKRRVETPAKTEYQERFRGDRPAGVTRLGDFIRIERLRQGMSQGDLSRLSGISQTGISMIELGNNMGNNKTRKALAMALGVPTVKLFELAGDL